jgi:hypothetical protein
MRKEKNVKDISNKKTKMVTIFFSLKIVFTHFNYLFQDFHFQLDKRAHQDKTKILKFLVLRVRDYLETI